MLKLKPITLRSANAYVGGYIDITDRLQVANGRWPAMTVTDSAELPSQDGLLQPGWMMA